MGLATRADFGGRPVDARIGTVIADHRVEAVIGEGGMGVIYRVKHVRLAKTRALKLLPPWLAHDAAFRERFEREWQLAASIDHPAIVEVIDAGRAGDDLFILMRYVDGSDLGRLLDRDGPLAPQRALTILEQVASALDAAHARGLVHRDVKPANILVAGGDRAFLSDFGVAKDTATGGLTRPDFFVGSSSYASPEQIEGQPIDGRTDVYALAGVLYTCLTGGLPYGRDSEVAALRAHLLDPPPSLREARPDLPAELGGAIATAMAKSKQDRHGTCGELMAAVRAALSLPVEAGGKTTLDTGPGRTRLETGRTIHAVVAEPEPLPGGRGSATRLDDRGGERRGRLSGRRVGLATVPIAVLIVAGVLAGVLRGSPPITVPDVVDQQHAAAQAVLEDAGFVVSASKVPSDEEEGIVVGQDPDGGVDVEKGATVRLDVAEGPQPVAVPDVVGRPVAEAEAALAGAGLRVETTVVPSRKPEGLVLTQGPLGGAESEPGAVVHLEISEGPRAALLAMLPENMRALCDLEPNEFPERAIAKVKCEPANGLAHAVQYNLFANAAVMRQAFNAAKDDIESRLEGSIPAGNCGTDAFAIGTWSVDNETKGRMFCYEIEGSTWIEWTDKPLLVYAWAFRTDLNRSKLNSWWETTPGP